MVVQEGPPGLGGRLLAAHPAAQNLIAKYLPLPDYQLPDILANNVQRNVAQPIHSNNYFGRLDHNLTSRDKLFGRIAMQSSDQVANQINPNFPQFRYSEAYNWVTGWVHTFNPSLLNEFRFGVNNWGDNFVSPRTNTSFDIDTLGIGQWRVVGDGNRKLTPIEQGIPSMGFTIGDQQGREDDT